MYMRADRLMCNLHNINPDTNGTQAMTRYRKRDVQVVFRTAISEYRRLRKLKWNRSYLGGGAQRAWDACARAERGRKQK